MDRRARDSLLTLAIIFSMTVTGTLLGYAAGKHDASATLKFELIPCGR
jgi:hypothetical protein